MGRERTLGAGENALEPDLENQSSNNEDMYVGGFALELIITVYGPKYKTCSTQRRACSPWTVESEELEAEPYTVLG